MCQDFFWKPQFESLYCKLFVLVHPVKFKQLSLRIVRSYQKFCYA